MSSWKSPLTEHGYGHFRQKEELANVPALLINTSRGLPPSRHLFARSRMLCRLARFNGTASTFAPGIKDLQVAQWLR